MWKFSTVLLLLALPPTVNSNETPTPRMCAVCLEKDCANGVRRIYLAGSDTPVWVKANSPTEIQTCSMENLKPACADLNLPPSSTPSPVTKTPIHNTLTPAAPNISVADNKDSGSGSRIGIGGGIGIFFGIVIVIVIVILIGVLIWKRKSRGQGQDRVPAHDPEHRNENTMEMQRLNVEDANENVNGVHREDDSVGTAG
ncbi:hypothetical protein ANANG_G00198040 [Anguilla anguilla]|uniref:Uncharacterized protein n=1 Tax=Anguilla anguilla TaxID=7936 RepID=A0A9D3M2C8_ANGAN|nr:hypothetical protein ANANG_G00198040 [Anguilla anguilla]